MQKEQGDSKTDKSSDEETVDIENEDIIDDEAEALGDDDDDDDDIEAGT